MTPSISDLQSLDTTGYQTLENFIPQQPALLYQNPFPGNSPNAHQLSPQRVYYGPTSFGGVYDFATTGGMIGTTVPQGVSHQHGPTFSEANGASLAIWPFNATLDQNYYDVPSNVHNSTDVNDSGSIFPTPTSTISEDSRYNGSAQIAGPHSELGTESESTQVDIQSGEASGNGRNVPSPQKAEKSMK